MYRTMAKHTCSFFRTSRRAVLAASLAAFPVLAEEAAPMSAAEAAPAIAPDIRQELLHELPAADIRWLEAESGRFPVLLRREVLGDSRGGVILLHGYQRNLNWPEVIKPLRELLSEGGWYTVSVPLPPNPPAQDLAPPEPDPMRPPMAKDEMAGAASGTEAADAAAGPDAGAGEAKSEQADYRGIVAQRVTAAVKLLNGEGQFNVVLLGYEAGANWALDHFKGQVRDSLAGLVMIDARNRVRGLANQEWFLGLLVDEKRPVLDMSGPAEDLQADAARRAGVARRAKLPAYRSMRRMKPDSSVRADDPDLARVRAWMEKNVRRELVSGK